MIFMYHSAIFKYEDSFLRYMDLELISNIHKAINISNEVQKETVYILIWQKFTSIYKPSFLMYIHISDIIVIYIYIFLGQKRSILIDVFYV